MNITKKIKVLIVDDSLFFREFLSKGLSSDPAIEVVATAADVFDAEEKIQKYNPDVMTLDVEMPKMSGIEFLKKLMPNNPLPVIVISAASESVFDALNAGAVDFVAKLDIAAGRNADSFVNDLKLKIKIASIAKLTKRKKDPNSVVSSFDPSGKIKLIAILEQN